MTAAAFRRALDALDWSYADAAHELGAVDRNRVGEWARGDRAVPPYIAAAVRTHLELRRCRSTAALE